MTKPAAGRVLLTLACLLLINSDHLIEAPCARISPDERRFCSTSFANLSRTDCRVRGLSKRKRERMKTAEEGRGTSPAERRVSPDHSEDRTDTADFPRPAKFARGNSGKPFPRPTNCTSAAAEGNNAAWGPATTRKALVLSPMYRFRPPRAPTFDSSGIRAPGFN